jgi:hypothetical protein
MSCCSYRRCRSVDAGEQPAAVAARNAANISTPTSGRSAWRRARRPGYEVGCPGGDRTAYIIAVYEAGSSQVSRHPSDGKLSEFAWFTPGRQSGLQPSRFSRALLHAAGRL